MRSNRAPQRNSRHHSAPRRVAGPSVRHSSIGNYGLDSPQIEDLNSETLRQKCDHACSLPLASHHDLAGTLVRTEIEYVLVSHVLELLLRHAAAYARRT